MNIRSFNLYPELSKEEQHIVKLITEIVLNLRKLRNKELKILIEDKDYVAKTPVEKYIVNCIIGIDKVLESYK